MLSEERRRERSALSAVSARRAGGTGESALDELVGVLKGSVVLTAQRLKKDLRLGGGKLEVRSAPKKLDADTPVELESGGGVVGQGLAKEQLEKLAKPV